MGATLTIIIVVVLVSWKVWKSTGYPNGTLGHKVVAGSGIHSNTVCSTKPLLRSSSPRDGDEKDPDIIPAKFESPNCENGRHVNMSSNGNTNTTAIGHLPLSASYGMGGSVSAQWISSGNQKDSSCHQYTNPVKVDTFPKDSRPKDLRLGNESSSTLLKATDLELNGFAIKERLMANRLPESCV
ncbi:hypothetical protein HHI36_001737 [Cryptolaemus montrouzieri]|uniref:Prolactin receptor n=1 Tax=Cryptolaemus montrouzieri TaxID=559131 RepID=A0ABD2P950_9CUCU